MRKRNSADKIVKIYPMKLLSYFTGTFLFATLIALGGFWAGAGVARASMEIPLSIKEAEGIARTGEMVHNGIPISRDENLTSINSLVIADNNGNSMPATFEVLSRWAGGKDDGTKKIQWLMVSFPAVVTANGSATYYLRDYGTPASPTIIAVNETVSEITINTGSAEFVVSKTSANGFSSIKLGGNIIADGGGSLQSTINGQTQALANSPTEVTIEKQNANHVSIKVVGKYANTPIGTNPIEPLHYRLRYEFFAGSPTAIITNKTFWPGANGDIGYGAPIVIDDVSLTLPGINNAVSTLVAANSATQSSGAPAVASVSQKRRNLFSDPNLAEVIYDENSATTTFADKPVIISQTTQGGIAVSFDHMQRFEPQKIEITETGSITARMISEQQKFSSMQGTWSRMSVTALSSEEGYAEFMEKGFAPLNNRLIAFPEGSYVAATKVFQELPTSVDEAAPSQVQTWFNTIKAVTVYTKSWLENQKFQGGMTWGALARDPLEIGSGNAWDKIYSGANLTDYHNAWQNVFYQWIYERNDSLLTDYAFAGARRMLHTQGVQPNNYSSPSSSYMGWSPAGYNRFRENFNSSHSYYYNLFTYYYLTGDQEVIDFLRVGAETRDGWYTRSGENLNDSAVRGVDFVSYADRVGFQAWSIFNFLGHADNAKYLDDAIHMYRHALTHPIALLNQNGNEYIFITGDSPITGSITGQSWMSSQYFLNGLYQLWDEYGDMTLGNNNLSLSRTMNGSVLAFKTFHPTLQDSWTSNWANSLVINFTGSYIGGDLTSASTYTGGSDTYLYSDGKIALSRTFLRAGIMAGDNSLVTLGKAGIDQSLTSSNVINAAATPWGKVNALTLGTMQNSVSYFEQSSDGVAPAAPSGLSVL